MKKKMLEKKKGAINGFLALILIGIGLFFLFFEVKKNTVSEMKVKCEDALVSATLAGALISVEEYGRSGSIIISDYYECYSNFKSCLDDNLKLDGQNNSEYTMFFASPIEVTEFIVYNVNEVTGEITVMEGNGNFLISQYNAFLGSTYAPNGTLIENTSIYSKIQFDARITDTHTIFADKDCCVDITER